MSNYYNEIDPYAAQWLRNLIAAGYIGAGDVDERSIEDVTPDELADYTQCHFFAGIGVWAYALRQAGWSDDWPVWTGSCPCQPFSAAGKGAGFADERHLWPAWLHLISERRPAVIFGEQVASKDSGPWLDLVHDDLEALDYPFGAVPFPSAGIGAPHIRDRLYWAAGDTHVAGRAGLEGFSSRLAAPGGWQGTIRPVAETGEPGRVADSYGSFGRQRGTDVRGRVAGSNALSRTGPSSSSMSCGLADTSGSRRGRGQESSDRGISDGSHAGRLQGDDGATDAYETGPHRLADATASGQRVVGRRGLDSAGHEGPHADQHHDALAAGPTNGLWGTADWLLCRDGKWRPVEPGTFPLAHGAASRVGRLRAYGNAINAEAARAFIEACMNCQP